MTDLQAKAMMLADMPADKATAWLAKYREYYNQLRLDEQNAQDKGMTIEISDLTSAQWQRLAELVGKFEKADEKDEDPDWDKEDAEGVNFTDTDPDEPTNVFTEHDGEEVTD